MLTELRIRNFAIIESLTLPLAPRFNVLSGETGAGKSIIVGALGFILGERGSSDLIRTGADKATVEGVFDISGNADVARFADEKGIDTEDGTLILKREISQTGRGRAWANGSPVTAGVLGELGRQLVNLHGQHEAQTLLDPESQREILDRFGAAADEAAEVRLAHGEAASTAHEIATLTARRADAEKRADYLRHVVREIEAAQPKPDEDSLLESEARVLENADELRSLAQSVADSLTAEDEGVLDRLAGLSRS
ncbi:MAG TPA: AAA family ATPase, partial [Gemmatimonadaceae bacterium]